MVLRLREGRRAENPQKPSAEFHCLSPLQIPTDAGYFLFLGYEPWALSYASSTAAEFVQYRRFIDLVLAHSSMARARTAGLWMLRQTI
jgi:hypothetical protein